MADKVKIGVAKFIHDGNFARAEFDAGPDIMENNGLYDLLAKMDVEVTETKTATLTEEDEKEYGTICQQADVQYDFMAHKFVMRSFGQEIVVDVSNFTITSPTSLGEKPI